MKKNDAPTHETEKDRVRIFDTTLRDGEQSPGASMTAEEKMRIAKQLGVTAEGLTSAWLSGGGEDLTNRELSELLGYPAWMRAYGTIPIGYPSIEQNRRFRRPLAQMLHWNRYQPQQYRRHEQVDFYESTLRPFAMYRDEESVDHWPDRDQKLGKWADAFATAVANPSCAVEEEADFSKPRVAGQATKRRRKK
jgi:hypothetical protein